MNAEATRHRIPAVFIWGSFVVLAWAAFTALAGGGNAHADEEDPKPLSGLTSLVGGVVTHVVDPVVKTTADVVTEVATPVVDVAKKVVTKTAETVSTVPVVGETAANTVGTVGQTVSSLTDAVTEVVSDAPVSSIVHPVTDLVREVPVVGGVLDGLGATDLLDDSAGAVDGVVDRLSPVVENTLPPVVDALTPQLPGGDPSVTPGDGGQDGSAGGELPTIPTLPGAELLPTDAAANSASALAEAGPAARAWLHSEGTQGAAHPPASEAVGATADDVHSPASGPPALSLSPASSSAGPGGSSGGANAVLHHLPVHADGASTGAGLPADSALPPSPAGKTDVSPD